jgi:hypothetical protein
MATEYSPQVVTNGLVLALDAANSRSYVSGSTNWFNLANSTISGSLINGPTYSSANLGSIVFDGVDDYVNCGTPATTFSIGNEHTIIVWLKRDSSGGSSNQGTFQITPTTSPYSGWEMYIDKTTGAIGRYRNENGSFLYSTNLTPDNQWCMTAISGFRDSTNGFFATSLNGSSWVSFFTGNTSTNLNLVSNTPSNIGRWSGNNHYLKGSISSVSVYNRILSPQEIQQNFNALRGRYGL